MKLQPDFDFRLPQYRREVFMRFYQFHLKHNAFPGCVYYLIPHLTGHLDINQRLWFCFINGCTQNPVTSYIIFQQFPSLEELNIETFEAWHAQHWRKLDYDIDRRYQKGHLVEMVMNYKQQLKGMTQEEFFNSACYSNINENNFDLLWTYIMKNFFMFGRLSTFSYLEYLKIAGLPIECSHLFLEDKDGSKSHRNGLCKVLGRDDLEWHKSNPGFAGYTKDNYTWLIEEGQQLLNESEERFINEPFTHNVSYFTLESCLCTFKGMFRGRRYPNVYNDMLYDRIISAQKKWPGVDLNIFWQARQKHLPQHLRCEDTLHTKGLCKKKQQIFKTTGKIILLDDECFINDINLNTDEYSLDLR